MRYVFFGIRFMQTLACAALIAFLVAGVAAWLRSYRNLDTLNHLHHTATSAFDASDQLELLSNYGWLRLRIWGSRITTDPLAFGPDGVAPVDKYWVLTERYGPPMSRTPKTLLPEIESQSSALSPQFYRAGSFEYSRTIYVPWYLVTLLLATVPSVDVVRALKRRRIRLLIAAGICVSCGYDLLRHT